MRKLLIIVAAFGLLLSACAQKAAETPSSPASPAATAADCAKTAPLKTPGQLTVGTDNPSFPPWIINNDPTNGKGFEGALAYQVAQRMGFTPDQVKWVVVPFNNSYAPGPKDFDFDINNIEVTPEREQAVDFSDGYYDLPQALLVMKGSPIEHATTLAELKDSTFGAQTGTTSLTFINTVIQPTQQATVYDTTSDAKVELKNGNVDGLILDLPTAYFEATDSKYGTKGSALVGKFASTGHLGMLFEQGNTLVACVNKALDEMKADGTLKALQDKWLANYLGVPVIQ